MKISKGYYVFYDNGQDYEDHNWDVICITKTKAGAEKEVKRLEKWIEETNVILTALNGRFGDEDSADFSEEHKRAQDAADNIKIPYKEMLGCFSLYNKEVDGFVGYAEKPLIGDKKVNGKEEYVVYSNEHSAYWGPNRRGYFIKLNEAGRYSKEEAEDICNNARSHIKGEPPPEVMYELKELINEINQ